MPEPCPVCGKTLKGWTPSKRNHHLRACVLASEASTAGSGVVSSSREATEDHRSASQVYGKTPLSLRAQRDLIAVLVGGVSPDPDLHFLGFSQSIGCDGRRDDARYLMPWLNAMRIFDEAAGFRVVRYGTSGTDVLTDLPRISTLFDRAHAPANWAAYGHDTFAAYTFHDKPGGPHVVSDLAALGTLHSTKPISHLVYEHRAWGTLVLKTPDEYLGVRKWCTENRVALVCDEVLTFLTTDCPLAFSYLQVGGAFCRPDFVLVGKYCGLAVLLMCEIAASLLPPPPPESSVDPVEVFLNLVRTDRTIFVDVTVLQRSTVLLETVVSNGWLVAGAKITRELPQSFRAAGLPVPAHGGGFLWKYSVGDRKRLTGLAILSDLDVAYRVRFFLDTDMRMVDQLAAVWAVRSAGTDAGDHKHQD